MKKRKLSTRILAPIVAVTILFSIALYFMGALALNRLIEDSLDEMVAAKVVDIGNRQQQIADKGLSEAALFSRVEVLVENFIANQQESITVYMNSELPAIAGRLQDRDKYPFKGGKFVRVTSTSVDLSERLISIDLLERGKTAVAKEYKEDFLLTAFPIKDFQNRQMGVMVYVYDASERFALRDQIQWGIALISLVFLLLICIVMMLVLKTLTRPPVRGTSGLMEAADQVTSAEHDEISSSSRSLAESSSGPEAVVEETGAAIEDVASMVHHNADNVNSAKSFTLQMDQVTVSSNVVMARMNTAVNEIKKSSDDVAKIIKVIEEIAFQTNLLALNATIEDSVINKADQGLDPAVEVDSVLGEVIGHVAKVKNLVAEIVTVSDEQLEEIGRITN